MYMHHRATGYNCLPSSKNSVRSIKIFTIFTNYCIDAVYATITLNYPKRQVIFVGVFQLRLQQEGFQYSSQRSWLGMFLRNQGC